MSESLNDWFESIGNTFNSMGESIKDFFNVKDEEEREETNNKSEQMGDTANQVESLITDKFGAFYTMKDFLFEFWTTIQNSGEVQPDFKVTLPAFCGGGTYNVIDFTFYNNYRNYIHGLIAGICYFIYIKKLFHKIPTIIHN